MKRLFLACVGVLALAGTAAAADLPRPAPYYPPQAPVYAPAYTWSGFYLGVNGGGGWGRSSWSSTGPFDISGGLVGGTVGYNYQVGQAVFGVEGDIDYADISGSGSSAACPFGCRTRDSWLSTVRGRLGYAAGRFMPYVTGGAAFGDIHASTPGFSGVTTTKTGYTVGGGLEFALAGNWTAKAEYLYVDLGNIGCGVSCGLPAVNNVNFHANLGRAGLNYRF